MPYPKVSIIWLNYNSMSFIDLTLESLRAVADLDYPNDRYELIVVDNGSSDGSFGRIKEFLERKEGLRKKIIKLDHNLGFTGGNNIGFKTRDRESKYVVLLNNDAVPFKESLKSMVEYAEQYNVGGLNGILLRHGSKNIIDSAGGMIDEVLIPYGVGTGKTAPWILKKPFYITYADGAYALYRVDYVLKSTGERLFFEEFFGYGDDNVMGLLLWNYGYKVISIPEIVATHRRGSTFRGLNLYWSIRNRFALTLITNSRYKQAIFAHTLRSIVNIALDMRSISSYHLRVTLRTVYDGLELGKLLRNKYGLFIDLYRAPILEVSPEEFTAYYLLGIRRRLLRLYEEKVSRLIKKWEVE